MCKIKVVGCGGSGTMVVNILEKQKNVDIWLINSDSVSLRKSKAENKILIGSTGLGCGGDIERAKEFAQNSINEFKEMLKDTDVVFITTGIGGGTGSAVAPVIAKLAKELGVFSISIITKPFIAEGKERVDTANKCIAELKKYTNALFVIPNDKIFTLIDSKSRYEKGFEMIDDTIRVMIEAVVDILTEKGVINIDLFDIKDVVDDSKEVFLAIGKGDNVEQALDNAIKNQIMEYKNNILDTNRILINVEYTDENNFNVGDIKKIYNEVLKRFKKYKSLKVGNIQNDKLDSKIRVIIIASIK